MESFFQTASSIPYLQLLVPVGIARRKLHGVVASVSRAPHQLAAATPRPENQSRCWVSVSLCGSDLRFTMFTFSLKELTPQTVLRFGCVLDCVLPIAANR